ncbi:hypothetical protein FQA39_LY02104 [Lamprigera yunnana]|nr:hypothetical protein FQA39_LY02104 [Lamprigera yunnana]
MLGLTALAAKTDRTGLIGAECTCIYNSLMTINMSKEIENNSTTSAESGTVHMESINRISHLPAIEQTVQVATNVYCKVKDCSSVTNWTLSTAESTVQKAVEIGKPIVSQFEGPIKKVDVLLCNGLDYVEEKIPAVKLPAGEIILQMYTTTKEYVSNKIQPAVQTAKNIVEPAVEVAYHVVEPAVNSVRVIAEPYVQPAVECVCALKDFGCQKMNEILNYHPENNGFEACQYCTQKAQSIHSE